MTTTIKKGYSYGDLILKPEYSTIKSRAKVNFETKITKNYSLSMPLIASDMSTICESEMAIAFGEIGGLGVIHRFLPIKKQVEEVKKVKEKNLLCAAAVGVKDYKKRVPALIESGLEILVIDIAHGHSKQAKETLKWIKKNYSNFPVDVMVGNIATANAAREFCNRGADAVKVGIGPGSMCTTRIMTGYGVPQMTAIMDCYTQTSGRIPLCADGGITVPGDVVKAIGAGANTVMIGYVIAGTNETPGKIIHKEGKEYKEYMGMASYDATIKRHHLDGKKADNLSLHVEGEKTLVECRGPVKRILTKYLQGLASGMSYGGAKNIEDICGKAEFIEISSAGMKESIAHGII
jgi:IMP dehydrogenase